MSDISGFQLEADQEAERPGWCLAEERDGWLARARGVDVRTRSGDYFTGRRAALQAVIDWLGQPASGRPFVVTGGPGSGKSALVARLVVLADPELRSSLTRADTGLRPPVGAISIAVDVRNFRDPDRQLGDITRRIAEKAGISTDDPLKLIEFLNSRPTLPFTVVVDALDEAGRRGDRQAERVASGLLRPLARDAAASQTRVLVATRETTADRRRSLIALLGVERQQVLDLDRVSTARERQERRRDMAEYCRRCLLLDADPNSRSPYRGLDPQQTAAIARAIARDAYPSYLVAGITSRALADRPSSVDLSDPHWRRFPRNVHEAMEEYLDRFGSEDARRAQDLLEALAYAFGAGFPRDTLWPLAAGAISNRSYSVQDVKWLRGNGGDYLVEEVPRDMAAAPAGKVSAPTRDGAGTEPAVRLFHQALADHLYSADQARAYQASLVAAFSKPPAIATHQPSGLPDWTSAPWYLRMYLPAHAAVAGRLDELVLDPAYLVTAEPGSLLPWLRRVTGPDQQQFADVYRAAKATLLADQAARTDQLELAAMQAESQRMARALREDPRLQHLRRGWRTRWAHPSGQHPHEQIPSRCGEVSGLAGATVDGEPVLAIAGEDGRVWLMDLTDNELFGEVTENADVVCAVGAATIAGRPVFLFGDGAGVVRIWDPAGDETIGLLAHTDAVEQVAGVEVQGRTYIVTLTGTLAGVGRAWRWTFDDGQWRAQELIGQNRAFRAVDAVAGDRAVAIAGSQDGSLTMWDLTSGAPLGAWPAHPDAVVALAAGHMDVVPVVLSAAADGTAYLWDLAAMPGPAAGRRLGPDLGQHVGPLNTAALAPLRDRWFVLAGTEEGPVLVRDARSGERIAELEGASDPISALVTAEAEGRPIVIAGSEDATVRIWDLARAREAGDTLSYAKDVSAVTTVPASGAAVTGAYDGAVWFWDLGTGRPVGTPIAAGNRLWGLASAVIRDKPVLLTAHEQGPSGTIRLWDLATRTADGDPVATGAPAVQLAAVRLGDLPVAVVGTSAGTVEAWDLVRRHRITTVHAHSAPVTAIGVASAVNPPVAVSAGEDGQLRIWGLPRLEVLCPPVPTGEPVVAMMVCDLDGRVIAVTGTANGDLRLWDLTGTAPVGKGIGHHEGRVHAIAAGASVDQHVAISAGRDQALRRWDLRTGQELGHPLMVMGWVSALSVTGNLVLVGLPWGLAAVDFQ
jgi:WD40 repeat protein